MNIKVAPANERSSADGDCKIRKVLQGLKPTFYFGPLRHATQRVPRSCPVTKQRDIGRFKGEPEQT
jgi:hypothetical protein